MIEFTVKCPVIVCTQTARETKSRGNKLLRKPILSGPLVSDIVTVRDMSEIATENNVYCIKFFMHLQKQTQNVCFAWENKSIFYVLMY